MEDLEERELNRVLLIDSTPSTTPTDETTLSIDDVHIGDLVLLRGNEDKRYYVGKVTECFPDTDEFTLHYFAHQMTHSGGRRGTLGRERKYLGIFFSVAPCAELIPRQTASGRHMVWY